MQNAKKAQRDNGQCLPNYPKKKTLGLSVIYSMPTGRPVEGPNPSRFPTHRPTQSTLNNGARVSDDGRENESVETPTAHAQNPYWTSTFCNFHGA